MTITTTQYQTVRQALNIVLDGQELDMAYAENESLYNEFLEAFSFNEEGMDFSDVLEQVRENISLLDKVVNNIIDYYDMEIFSEIADNFDFEETLDILENEDIRVYYDIFEMADVAREFLEDTDGVRYHADSYTDEDALLRDLYLGGDIAEYHYQRALDDALEDGLEPHEAHEIASNYEITDEDEQSYLEAVIECADKNFLTRYFDYESFGRDMYIDGTFYTTDSGIIEITK